jgi:hypothetical protein
VFIGAYNKNIEIQNEEVIESNQTTLCLRQLIFVKYGYQNGDDGEECTGTPSALLGEFEAIADDLKIKILAKGKIPRRSETKDYKNS